MIKASRLLSTAAVIYASFGSVVASAATLTYNFTGSVLQVSTGAGPFSVGQAWTGSFTFETTGLPTGNIFTGPPSSSYSQYLTAMTALHFQIGGYSVSATGGNILMQNGSYDDFYASTSVATGLVGPSANGRTLQEAYVRLFDGSGTVFNTALALPTALTLSQFTSASLNLNFYNIPFGGGSGLVYGSIQTLELAADVSSVPVPAAFPLFATILAGGGLIAWRRKRKAAKLAA